MRLLRLLTLEEARLHDTHDTGTCMCSPLSINKFMYIIGAPSDYHVNFGFVFTFDVVEFQAIVKLTKLLIFLFLA